ncbi:helix-turn-helix domain-containing protein [Pelistega europaea]|uniref:Helix-turn-helix transcriptional regulator n=1 Tax=Pelistega europaea TaxID=106147 RepID=A0A7Y4LAQ8_9BURK|nr:AraC family transcriptional regulator [Pelistega europaea]NOL50090.1 helix-turn-helix transcriptional regulator [Pelistega europaea]
MSYPPRSTQVNGDFPFITTNELKENHLYAIKDLALSVYTQHYTHGLFDNVPLHWHETFQIVWVSTGELDYCVNEEHFILCPDTLLLLNHHQLHTSHTTQQNVRTLCINFDCSIFSAFVQQQFIIPLMQRDNFSYALIPLSPQQLSKLQELSNLSHEKLYYFSLINFISQIIENTLKHLPSKIVNKKELTTFHMMVDYIHKNYAQPLTVAMIAKHALSNKNRCTALFKKYAHTSPIKYLNTHRLHIAREMLLHSDQSISEIALASGFNQISYFIVQFRLGYGKTPLQYRHAFT